MKINKFKHLVHYIIALDNFRQSSLEDRLTSAEILFNNKQFDLAVSDIKRYLKIPTNIKILVKVSSNLPKGVGGQIHIPMHLFGTMNALTHTFTILINPRLFHSFDFFTIVIAHELCHLKLFLSQTSCLLVDKRKKYLWNNEKAVDALVILSGFGDHYYRISKSLRFDSPGYISRAEFNFLYDCYKKNRKFTKKIKSIKSPRRSWWNK